MLGFRIWISIIILIVSTSILYLSSYKRIEHSITILPHWETSCPQTADAVLVIGQSQASNTGPQRHISFSNSRAFADGKCYYLRDPMPGTGGRGGTIWPIFADILGKKLVIADIAISGSAIEQWTTPDQQKKFKRTLASLRAAGYSKPLIIWMQGETNGARQTNSEDYYSKMRILLSIAPNNNWIITRESICYDMQRKWIPLDTARDKISRNFPNVTIGPDLDKMGLKLRQPDHCHFTAEGQAVLADSLTKIAQPLLD